MKKLVSVLLAVLLCLSLTASAFAETSYLTLQTLLASPDSERFYLGEAKCGAFETDEGVTMFLYYAQENKAILIGRNAENAGEITVWENVAPSTVIISLYGLCANWETIQARADEGVLITLGITFGDEQPNAWIDSAEDAAAFCENLQNLIQQSNGEASEAAGEEVAQ